MKLSTLMFGAVIIVVGGFGGLYNYGTVDYYNLTVNEKERVTTGSGDSLSSKYMVFTDKGVFENTDTIFYFKFSSSDMQNKLKVNGTYKVKTYGWRIPFFSMYENIVKVSEI